MGSAHARAIRLGCGLTVPQFCIVAGPNGSGKSTLIGSGLLDRWTGTHLQALSPDDIVLTLRASGLWTSEAELLRHAQEKSDKMVDEAIAAGQTIMVETVLSSSKFQLPVLRALESGFEFGFCYVIVQSAALNVERVADRVVAGGHDVPEDRIRARRLRSLAAVPWFAARATVGIVIENSRIPVILAEKQRGEATWRIDAPARLQELDILLDS